MSSSENSASLGLGGEGLGSHVRSKSVVTVQTHYLGDGYRIEALSFLSQYLVVPLSAC